MAAIVNIDQPLTELTLEAGGRQAVGFDVVNIADRHLHLVATAVPAHGATVPLPDWLTLDGEPTLRLGPNETRKITVRLAPPATTAAGIIPFRLKVYEVSLPEENNGFSEPVQITVTAAPSVAPKRPLKLIGALAAFALLVAIGGGWLAVGWLTPKELPALVGMSRADALERLAQSGLATAAITVVEPIAGNADGKVTAQWPPAGTEIGDEFEVTLTVPRRPTMPHVVKKPLLDALITLEEAGFDPAGIEIQQLINPDLADLVYDQSPAEGAVPEAGESVRLTAIRKRSAFLLPDLPREYMTGEEAVEFYHEQGLDVQLVVDNDTPGRWPGVVVSVLPPPRNWVEANATVRIRALSDKLMVPWLAGRYLSDPAVKALQASFDVLRRSGGSGPPNCITGHHNEGMLRRGSQIVLDITDGSKPGEECIGGRG